MESQNGGQAGASSEQNSPQPASFSPDQAQERLERLKGDSGFRERFINGDVAARDQWDSLNQQAASRPPSQISTEAAKTPADYGFIAGQFGNPADPTTGQEESAIRQGLHAAGFSPELGVSYTRMVSEQDKALEGLSKDEVDSWARGQRDQLEMLHGKDGYVAKAKKVEAFLQSIDKSAPGTKDRMLRTNGAWSAVVLNMLMNHIDSLEAQGKKF